MNKIKLSNIQLLFISPLFWLCLRFMYIHTYFFFFLSVSCIEIDELQTMGYRPLKQTMYAWPLCYWLLFIYFFVYWLLKSPVFFIIQLLVDFPPHILFPFFFPLLGLRAEHSAPHASHACTVLWDAPSPSVHTYQTPPPPRGLPYISRASFGTKPPFVLYIQSLGHESSTCI